MGLKSQEERGLEAVVLGSPPSDALFASPPSSSSESPMHLHPLRLISRGGEEEAKKESFILPLLSGSSPPPPPSFSRRRLNALKSGHQYNLLESRLGGGGEGKDMAACNRALGNHASPKYLPRRVVQKNSLLCLVVIGEFPRSCTSPGLLRKRIRRFFGGNVSYFVGFVLPSSMCRIFLFAISTRLLCSNLPAPTQFCLVAMYAENSTHVVRLFLFSPPSLPSFPTKWMVGRGGRPSPPLFCKGGPRKIAHHPLRRRRAQRLRKTAKYTGKFEFRRSKKLTSENYFPAWEVWRKHSQVFFPDRQCGALSRRVHSSETPPPPHKP